MGGGVGGIHGDRIGCWDGLRCMGRLIGTLFRSGLATCCDVTSGHQLLRVVLVRKGEDERKQCVVNLCYMYTSERKIITSKLDVTKVQKVRKICSPLCTSVHSGLEDFVVGVRFT